MQPQTYNIESILDDIVVIGKSIIPDFNLDEDLYRVYTILAMYFFYDARFEKVNPNYKLSKGLLIRGNVGTGKTLCLLTNLKLLKTINHPNYFVFYSTNDVVQDYLINGEERLLIHGSQSFKRISGNYSKNHPVTRCYDDLGIESKKIKHYGNERNLMADILLKRYDLFITTGLKTIVSTNYSPDEIEEYYGYRIRSRLREMMNDIVFEGDDRRK